MTLSLVRIESPGDFQRERVVLRATSDLDIGRYAIFSCVADEGVPLSGPVRNAYWFEDKKIKSGDLVVLYSKDGILGEKVSKTGATSYFYYWEASKPIWTKGTIPVVLLVTNWSYGSPITD